MMSVCGKQWGMCGKCGGGGGEKTPTPPPPHGAGEKTPPYLLKMKK